MGPATSEASVSAVQLVRDWDAMREREDEWRSAAQARGNAFLTPEWLYTWQRYYGDQAEPAVMEARDVRRGSIGWMPMTLSGQRWLRSLRFAGANLADYLHPLAESADSDAELAAAFGARLGGQLTGWRILVLDNVDAQAGWLSSLLEAAPMRLIPVTTRRTELPYAVLPASWDDYLASRSRNFRSEVGRKLRRLEREHEVRFRLTTDSGELRRDLDTFFRLHDARWEGRGGSSSRTRRARAFHHDFSADALKRGWLRLWTMEVDREPVAAWYGWKVGRRYSYYLAGFEPRWAHASVGFLLLAHTVRGAIEEGAAEYDLLLGEEAYKRRFATDSRCVETVLLTRARDPIRLLVRGQGAVRSAYRRLPRRLRDRLRSPATAAGRRLPAARSR
jgi:CelD/BcsL family acetyltransferase involved in cellulose biosynthesis